jgi:hypothetical protein
MLPPVCENEEGATFCLAFLLHLRNKIHEHSTMYKIIQASREQIPNLQTYTSLQYSSIIFIKVLKHLILQRSSVDSFIQLCVPLDGRCRHRD